MHRLMKSDDDRHDRQSSFYKTLQAIGDLGHIGAFVLPICTAIGSSVENALLLSTRTKSGT